jgi:hypothetical protein
MDEIKTTHRSRDSRGRYELDNLDLVCACGHRLGEHCAGGRPGAKRECFEDGCSCDAFRVRRTRTR